MLARFMPQLYQTLLALSTPFIRIISEYWSILYLGLLDNGKTSWYTDCGIKNGR